jgi:hypothetical protein
MKTLIAATVLTTLGCAHSGALEQTLRTRRGELMYLHDAPPAERQPGTLSLAGFAVEGKLPPDTTVDSTGGWVVPLLFVNLWKHDYRSALGAGSVTNDCAQFIKESLVAELKRSSKYAWAESDGETQLDVRVTKIETAGALRNWGMFLFFVFGWSYHDHMQTAPVEVLVEAEAVARRQGKELLRKQMQGKSQTLPPAGKEAVIEDYTTAMIEGLSAAVKDLNDHLVSEINQL